MTAKDQAFIRFFAGDITPFVPPHNHTGIDLGEKSLTSLSILQTRSREVVSEDPPLPRHLKKGKIVQKFTKNYFQRLNQGIEFAEQLIGLVGFGA